MEDNKIIDNLISILETEDLWFTQKTDPTFGEAPDYFKLDEYGDLTDASVKKIVKEIKSYIGDGAVDEEDAINIWLQDAMADNKIAYRDILVTKFKDKPVVDGIEAYKNPVQLDENKKVESIYDLDKDAEIKKGKCPYCGSTKLEYEDDAREPRVAEYDDYVSYGWHCKDCGKDGQEIFGMEFLGHDLYRDDEDDSQTDFIGKTESKKIKKEATEYDEYIASEQKLAGQYMERLNNQISQDARVAFADLKDILDTEHRDTNVNGFYFPAKAVAILENTNLNHNLNKYMNLTISDILNMVDDNETIEGAINDLFKEYRPDSALTWGDNFISVLEHLDFDVHTDDDELYEEHLKNKKEENAKRRLKEENNKSANLISQMMQEKGFDAESNAGKIVLRTSALFNALSEKGYDVQVAFDNGESTSAVLLGEQGGQVLITITDAQQQLKSFASGNFEVTDDNMAILNNVADIVKTV